jgi:RNA polymerase sigma factor (sigma-70 family)
MTDNIFEEFLRGDPNGIRTIYLVCKGPLTEHGIRIIGREDVVADIVTDAIILLRDHVGEFESDDRIWQWLYITVRNKCWNERRKMRLLTYQPREAEGPSDLEATQSVDYKDYETFIRRITQLVREELQWLPPKRSRDFDAYYFKLKSIEQIALERGVSEDTVADNVAHALKAIRNT